MQSGRLSLPLANAQAAATQRHSSCWTRFLLRFSQAVGRRHSHVARQARLLRHCVQVIHSVEQVYDHRKALARTLSDSQTVVAQVERAIYVTLLVILVFVIMAIFDPDSLQRTWTGLSAGLLSFSFIFGNSIRQV